MKINVTFITLLTCSVTTTALQQALKLHEVYNVNVQCSPYMCVDVCILTGRAFIATDTKAD